MKFINYVTKFDLSQNKEVELWMKDKGITDLTFLKMRRSTNHNLFFLEINGKRAEFKGRPLTKDMRAWFSSQSGHEPEYKNRIFNLLKEVLGL